MLTSRLLRTLALLLFCSALAHASAYNGKPRLVVLIVLDQFRGDYLERYREQFAPDGGLRMLIARGAVFTDAHYDYANTRTAPGHATISTGAYSNSHGVIGNEMWSEELGKVIESTEDHTAQLVGPAGATGKAHSPRVLQAGTFADELKLATQGRARIFGVAFKDRSAILPAGFSGQAYWIDRRTGAFVTSTYYRNDLPAWVTRFNASGAAQKYIGRQWRDAQGNVFRDTKVDANSSSGYYDSIGMTPFSSDYLLDFTRELIANEKLGTGPATDFLSVSFAGPDILGHKVGPDDPSQREMILATDRQLGAFFRYLDRQFGLQNVWIALSADHGIAPLPAFASKFHVPSIGRETRATAAQLNTALNAALSPGQNIQYVDAVVWPSAYLNERNFGNVKLDEAAAEKMVGEALGKVAGMRGYFTKWQIIAGGLPQDHWGGLYSHSYIRGSGWYVMGIPTMWNIDYATGTDHFSPYRYDQHVPVVLMGTPFRAGLYRTPAEPVDIVSTLSVLLGINRPTSSVGRVLTEAIVENSRAIPAARTGAQIPR